MPFPVEQPSLGGDGPKKFLDSVEEELDGNHRPKQTRQGSKDIEPGLPPLIAKFRGDSFFS